MVNAKYVAFTVNKQTPFLQTPDQAYATVINCRRPGGKRAGLAQEVRSHNVPLAMVEGSLKRTLTGRGVSVSSRVEVVHDGFIYSIGGCALNPLRDVRTVDRLDLSAGA